MPARTRSQARSLRNVESGKKNQIVAAPAGTGASGVKRERRRPRGGTTRVSDRLLKPTAQSRARLRKKKEKNDSADKENSANISRPRTRRSTRSAAARTNEGSVGMRTRASRLLKPTASSNARRRRNEGLAGPSRRQTRKTAQSGGMKSMGRKRQQLEKVVHEKGTVINADIHADTNEDGEFAVDANALGEILGDEPPQEETVEEAAKNRKNNRSKKQQKKKKTATTASSAKKRSSVYSRAGKVSSYRATGTTATATRKQRASIYGGAVRMSKGAGRRTNATRGEMRPKSVYQPNHSKVKHLVSRIVAGSATKAKSKSKLKTNIASAVGRRNLVSAMMMAAKAPATPGPPPAPQSNTLSEKLYPLPVTEIRSLGKLSPAIEEEPVVEDGEDEELVKIYVNSPRYKKMEAGKRQSAFSSPLPMVAATRGSDKRAGTPVFGESPRSHDPVAEVLSAKKAVQTRPIAVNPDVRRVRFSEHVQSPTAKRGTLVVA